MDGIVLYTPGHHLITDSLMMHGIVRYLMWAGVNIDSVKIRRLGDRFAIEVGDPDSIKEDEAKQVLLSIQDQAARDILSGGDYTYLTRFFEKIDATNLNRPAFKEWIRQFSQAITRFYSDSVRIYVNYNHKEEGAEGYGRARVSDIVPAAGAVE
jgi:CRISPR-associated protein (Cas_Csa4).